MGAVPATEVLACCYVVLPGFERRSQVGEPIRPVGAKGGAILAPLSVNAAAAERLCPFNEFEREELRIPVSVKKALSAP